MGWSVREWRCECMGTFREDGFVFGRECERLNFKNVFFFQSQISISLKFVEISRKPYNLTQLKSVANSQSRILLCLALNYCSFSRWNSVPFAIRFVCANLSGFCPQWGHLWKTYPPQQESSSHFGRKLASIRNNRNNEWALCNERHSWRKVKLGRISFDRHKSSDCPGRELFGFEDF